MAKRRSWKCGKISSADLSEPKNTFLRSGKRDWNYGSAPHFQKRIISAPIRRAANCPGEVINVSATDCIALRSGKFGAMTRETRTEKYLFGQDGLCGGSVKVSNYLLL